MERKEITAVSGWERSGGALYGCVNGAPVQLTYCGDQVLAERPIARGAAHGAAPLLHRRHTGAAPWAAPWAAPVITTASRLHPAECPVLAPRRAGRRCCRTTHRPCARRRRGRRRQWQSREYRG